VSTVVIVVGSSTRGEHDIDDGTGATVTLTTTEAVAAELAGGLSPNVAFMQGRLKTAGDNGAVLRVLPVLTAALWASAG
jgi:hypothetical protein